MRSLSVSSQLPTMPRKASRTCIIKDVQIGQAMTAGTCTDAPGSFSLQTAFSNTARDGKVHCWAYTAVMHGKQMSNY
jgi:hypothetical protein